MTHDVLQSLVPPKPLASEFDLDSAAEQFHECTKYHRRTFFGQTLDIAKFLLNPLYIARGAAGFTDYTAHPILDLPTPQPLDAALGTVLAERRSLRAFKPSLTVAQLSSLLWHALHVNHTATSKAAPNVTLNFRPYPSPGNLNSLEFYVFLNQIDGVSPSIAHYDSRAHRLRILKNQDGKAFSRVEIKTDEGGIETPLSIVVAIVPQRMTAKYGARGYRLALLEAGHASQNIALVAQGLSLGSLVYASYYDDELADLLGLDGVTTTIASTLLLGEPA